MTWQDPLTIADDMTLVEESWSNEDSGVAEGLGRVIRRGDLERSSGSGTGGAGHSVSGSGGSLSVGSVGIMEDDASGGGALLKGDLLTRPKSGEGAWKAAHYVLEKGRLLVFEDRHHIRPKQVGFIVWCVGISAGIGVGISAGIGLVFGIGAGMS